MGSSAWTMPQQAYWQLHVQPRTAWTFEMDLRLYKEQW